eukprot:CAMPEP_0184732582 /NCGR_PEP_ID=MMETSP0314-20130426/54785_1 /TAXON_ID=38298 /ORGANISM="Rhodella maculata, Strain CCMP 736" /LENGTH=60 /DNA_ID=CAMNT_0027199205 /DNA_START=222 /DNA_END=400 /DNA_ORIENTATION=-
MNPGHETAEAIPGVRAVKRPTLGKPPGLQGLESYLGVDEDGVCCLTVGNIRLGAYRSRKD